MKLKTARFFPKSDLGINVRVFGVYLGVRCLTLQLAIATLPDNQTASGETTSGFHSPYSQNRKFISVRTPSSRGGNNFMKAPALSKVLLSIASMLIFFSLSASAQVGGALNVTNQAGTIVDYSAQPNSALSCDAVYITGGPQNQKDSGIKPDGTYFFMVTDPSGHTLLSVDANGQTDREVTVATVNGKGSHYRYSWNSPQRHYQPQQR
jgi:hypothetical protein